MSVHRDSGSTQLWASPLRDVQKEAPSLFINRMNKTLGAMLLSCTMLSACGGGGGGSDNADNEPPPPPPGNEPPPTVTSPVPGRSSTIALTSDDKRLVVVNRQNDTVSVIEIRGDNGEDAQNVLAEIPVGKEPRYVTISPDDSTAYVSNTVDGTVSVIDLAAATPAISGEPIAVGTEPRGLAITPNGKYVYVANHTQGSVSVIRTSSREVINTVKVGGNPMAVAITNDGDTDDLDETVLVTRFFSDVIDQTTPDGFDNAKEGKVDRFQVADSLEGNSLVDQLILNSIVDSGFTADRRQFCLETRRILENLPEGDAQKVVFFNSGADRVPDNADQGAGALKNNIFCPDPNSADASAEGPIAKAPQGVYPNQLFAAVIRDNRVYIPNIGAAPEPPVKFNVNVQALVTSIDLDSGDDVTTNLNNQIKTETDPSPQEAPFTLDRVFGNDLVAIDANAAGDQFLVVSRGGNYVIRATPATDGTLNIGAPNNVVRFQTGNIPSGVVMSRDGTRAYTNNEVNTSVTAIDLEGNRVLNRDIASSTPPAPGTQKHRNLVGKLAFFTALGIPDSHDTDGDYAFDIELRDIEPLQFRGKASDNGWSSCASCHEDGHSDNVSWIFPTGPRQTIALEGTFAKGNTYDQRILNWNGVRGSVTDFNNNSRGVQGGKGFATDVDGVDKTAQVFNHGPTKGISDALDAMTEWVANAVRAPIMPDPADTESLQRGREIFTYTCAACHGGAKWTKSSTAVYENDPTFDVDPLGADFFAGVAPRDEKLQVLGPQINAIAVDGEVVLQFLENVGTLDNTSPLELRGAGAIAGQSTQGFGSLGGAGFNVPSLLGVAYHSPYLHDGSAVTLDDVFARHALSGAGTIAEALDNEQRADLTLFLLSIDDDTPEIALPNQ